MNCLIFVGSPGKKAGAMQAAAAMESALAHEGVDAELVWINDRDIGACVACRKGCKRDWPGFCYHKRTDMSTLGRKIIDADRIVFVATISSWHLPVPLKALLSRLVQSFSDHYGEELTSSVWPDKKPAFIAVCPFSPNKDVAQFEQIMCQHCEKYHIPSIETLPLKDSIFPFLFMSKKNRDKIESFSKSLRSEVSETPQPER